MGIKRSKPIKTALVRGKYLNNFEGQNYIFDKKKVSLIGISSLMPLNRRFPFPVIRLASLADLAGQGVLAKGIKFLTNRLIGDSQILFGLEKYHRQFDIFHTADPHYYYSYQLAKLRKKNLIKKLISTSWETIPFNNESVRQKKFIKKFTQRYVDLFICYTERARKALLAEEIDDNKIKVIRLGADLNRFKYQISNIKNQKNKSKIKKTILFVGRFVEEKGIYDLRKAMEKIENARLKIVNFGSVSYQNMPKIYQLADILVVPSKTTKTWEEQYGMVLVEAMASGLPIAAYDTGAIAEVVGDCAILVDEGDINQLAFSIKRLMENESLRLKLGKMGRERAEKHFDSKKTALEIEKIYENINGSHYQ